MELAGKVALVAAAGSGLGWSVALAFAEAGATALVDLDERAVRETLEAAARVTYRRGRRGRSAGGRGGGGRPGQPARAGRRRGEQCRHRPEAPDARARDLARRLGTGTRRQPDRRIHAASTEYSLAGQSASTECRSVRRTRES
jgi:NAD(P)-dependent dehydrogenase (short-subunit alcohol dehydrogenase family)